MNKPGQQVISRLRQMILSGDLASGQRLAEIPTAEQLGVSRTPVRIAFRTLEQEGLLTKLSGRGYIVRQVTQAEISGSIEVRGVLEGLAARQAAENSLSNEQKHELLTLLRQGDDLFVKGSIDEQDLALYHDINQRFHQIIIEASLNPAIAEALSRNEHLPFASVSALAFDQNNLAQEYRRFNFAHMQHHAVFDAITNGQGSRAEAIMREHANATHGYAKTFSKMEESGEKMQVLNNVNSAL
ncbi:MAG: GntR family transcriptional regulator [Marinomonas foliarum]|jgi:GntR family transcriptional regulator, vanillate catabolism transcriptional regulator|uniref:GntR family transcriptional regulator n=1 Tax=Marinomonas foliarum TaxID=491950 RepID=A0A368ZL60_9GAMM|nr:GntR family transcriptional regulator [Marinomonas foliarum]QRV24800.1 GntR family transcriptional regulator [Marinomonas foliarum]RCW95052.1 GntR family transcriptional regulator [Marinomonas foliarum]